MNNCGISFGNILKNVASGDTITFHYSLFTLHFSLPHKPSPLGEGGKNLRFLPDEGFCEAEIRISNGCFATYTSSVSLPG
ncbi:MAG: hypothetical protein IJB91_07015 [Oscillospiraceae bacterium]|nr:hypothetical protein [Oscillospiraceae bacterium]